MNPPPPLPNRLLLWADRLLYAGLVLAVLTWAIDGLGMLTYFLIPCCFWLGWVGYVASGLPSADVWRWLRAGLGTLLGHAVLFWMCRNGYLKSALVCGAELLLALGWLANRRRGWRPVAATAAVALGGWAAIAWLGLKSGSLFEAARANDRAWVKALLWSGADPNQVSDRASFIAGIPLLYEAIQANRDPAIVALLLRHGANPNAYWKRADGSVVQPVAFAMPIPFADPGSHQVLHLLLQAGLNPCQRDQHGQTLRASWPKNYRLLPADSVLLAAAERRCGCR